MSVVKDAKLGPIHMLKPSKLYGGVLRQAVPVLHSDDDRVDQGSCQGENDHC